MRKEGKNGSFWPNEPLLSTWSAFSFGSHVFTIIDRRLLTRHYFQAGYFPPTCSSDDDFIEVAVWTVRPPDVIRPHGTHWSFRDNSDGFKDGFFGVRDWNVNRLAALKQKAAQSSNNQWIKIIICYNNGWSAHKSPGCRGVGGTTWLLIRFIQSSHLPLK